MILALASSEACTGRGEATGSRESASAVRVVLKSLSLLYRLWGGNRLEQTRLTRNYHSFARLAFSCFVVLYHLVTWRSRIGTYFIGAQSRLESETQSDGRTRSLSDHRAEALCSERFPRVGRRPSPPRLHTRIMQRRTIGTPSTPTDSKEHAVVNSSPVISCGPRREASTHRSKALPALALISTTILLAAVYRAHSSSRRTAPQSGETVAIVSRLNTSQTWELDCEHTLPELEARVPLTQTIYYSEVPRSFKKTGVRTNRACFTERCFRAVHERFATDEECGLMLQGIEALFEPGSEGLKGNGLRDVTADNFAPHLLDNITTRMAELLTTAYGATRPIVSTISVRGQFDVSPDAEKAGAQRAVERRAKLRRGKFVSRSHNPHIDAAKMPEWLWTCLLYVGEHDTLEGGELLLIDRLSPRGTVSAGMLVPPLRGRLVAFTSGSENVHVALPTLRGRRAVLQVWFTCAAE